MLVFLSQTCYYVHFIYEIYATICMWLIIIIIDKYYCSITICNNSLAYIPTIKRMIMYLYCSLRNENKVQRDVRFIKKI